MALTGDPGVDQVVAELADHAAEVLGPDMIGAYIEGSFALGAGDPHSDVDFIVVTGTPLDDRREDRLRAFHRELPTRRQHWAKHLEGSYAVLADLLDSTRTGRAWLFVDHGQQHMSWDIHGNDLVHRWVLREHGIVVRGAPPGDIVAPVSAAELRREAQSELGGLPQSLLSWLDLRIAWSQRYFVVAYCRVLFTLANGYVASKPEALLWAGHTFDPAWRPLFHQVTQDRVRGLTPTDSPRDGAVESSLAFAAYADDWASTHHP
ncbi:MAG: aminoglycoside adenylyltransferase domain-containing protein [bacterium]